MADRPVPTTTPNPADQRARGVRLGVLGWPVAHSRSPAIQNAALHAAGLADWRYQLLPAPPELFDRLTRALPGAGFRGANVTIPHKEAALVLATDATPRARAIGAANTLTFGPEHDPGATVAETTPDPGTNVAGSADPGTIVADNTDAPAIIAALPFPPAGRTALVLGAGGSARAAVWALLDAGARSVLIWNRTPDRARRLADDLGATPTDRPVPADVLVNCTAAGLDGGSSLASLPITADQLADYGCVVDLVYTAAGTDLITEAQARQIPAVDGLELLIGQGALSFERFTGRRPSLTAMRAAVHGG